MKKVLYSGRVYTMDRSNPISSALALDFGRILGLGEDDFTLGEFGDGAERINLEGKTVIPGLVDAHIHLEQYALVLEHINCETATREECLQKVAEKATESKPGEWILGHGWNQNDWEEGYGYAPDLDRAAPDNPVFLSAKSLHAAWVNSAALKLARISPATDDPPGGRFSRDESGSPDGLLFETAIQVVQGIIPEPSLEEVCRAVMGAQRELWRMGLTGCHDFDRRRCFQALQILRERGKLGLRVLKSIPVEDLTYAVSLGLRSGFGDDMLRVGNIKIFADGALGPRTAAMLQPYEGEPANRGILLVDSEGLYETGREAVGQGFGLAVHAIGDRANHEVLLGLERLGEYEKSLPGGAGGGRSEKVRHRIEHVQVLHPEDVNRLAELGVVASMQPIHALSDFMAADRYWGGRSRYAYGWKSQLEAGSVLAFGSDAPVEAPDPFLGLYSAVTRRRLDGTPGPAGWYSEQRISIQEAVAGYTLGAAYAAGMEDRLGKLAPGCLADLVVLDRDPFNCPPEELLEVQPLRTMVGGEWVYTR